MSERPSLTELGADLAAEQADLVAVVTPLDDDRWATSTPAVGWSVRDQIAHLAYFDGAAALAASDPDAFETAAARLAPGGQTSNTAAAGLGPRQAEEPGVGAPGGETSNTAAAGLGPRQAEEPGVGAPGGETSIEAVTLRRELTGAATLAWWQRESAGLHRIIAGLEPAQRIPWYGPPMSALSMVTARIMETWAHGQDVSDALNVARVPTARLRHIAHIGVRTLAFSYVVRGREPPATPVRVELTAPDGGTWAWGPTDAADVVRGSAIDFCLVVTQRRHRQDTALESKGPVATEWLGLAQAYAGPPGPGRPAISS